MGEGGKGSEVKGRGGGGKVILSSQCNTQVQCSFTLVLLNALSVP